jgi:biotin carboxyl carrier protein
MTPFKVIVGGLPVQGTIDRKPGGRIEATLEDRQYVIELAAVEPGISWLKLGNLSYDVTVVRNQGGYTVSLGGHRMLVEIEGPRSGLRRTASKGHSGIAELRAPMPGKVVRLLVKEGAEVEVNQGIVVVEAMKMQNEIKSPKAGVVRKLPVSEGATVNSGDLLATVE